jgi:hypothetical protein
MTRGSGFCLWPVLAAWPNFGPRPRDREEMIGDPDNSRLTRQKAAVQLQEASEEARDDAGDR